MPGWSKRPLFKNPTMMVGGGYVGMPKGMSIPGYQDGSMVEEMPAYRQEQLAKETEYQKAIEKTARLFSASNPKAFDYMSNIHYFAGNLSGGHQIPKEQVMQDLMKAIEAQRSAPEMKTGGIVGLENGGMMPELFEGEEIVETNPTINAMAAQGGGDLAGEAMPERNVPNERGIISMALETEDEPVEDDEPMLVLAKQEAKARLDEEFRIIKSTAEAEAATGGSPSAVIKSGMDGLARSARRIETETADKYPEVPADANLISSEDLVPYREEFVAMFKAPEIGTEEPMMQDIVMAKNGGKIPGYEDGGVADVPEEWSWIDEDIRAKGMSLEESEREMIQRYGSDITAMRKILRKDRETSPREKEKIRRGMSLEELANMDTREADLITAMKEMGFETASQPSIFQRKQKRTMDIIKNPEVRKLIDQYRAMGEPLSAVQGQEQGDPQAGDQGQGDPVGADLPTTEEMLEQGTVSAGGNTAIPPNFDQMTPEEKINVLAQLMQQEDPLSAVREQAETLKDTYKTGLEDVSSILQGSVTEYEKEAKNRNNKIDDIFADIEKRIPMQARVSGRLSPFTGGGAQASLVRGLRTQEIEQNLFQQNNANKIAYEKLRKEELEARRKQDLDALYDIKLKQAEILSGIDKSMLDAEAALMQAEIENDLAMELEQLKVELGTTGKTYGAQATISQRDKSPDVPIEEGMQFAIQKYGPVAATENYYVLQGTKNIQGKQMSFPEFYNAYIGKQYVPKDSKKTKKHTVKTVVALWLGV
jgi:hypothetical protein